MNRRLRTRVRHQPPSNGAMSLDLSVAINLLRVTAAATGALVKELRPILRDQELWKKTEHVLYFRLEALEHQLATVLALEVDRVFGPPSATEPEPDGPKHR